MIRTSAVAKKKIRSIYPLIVASIKRQGNIAPYAALMKTFSQEAIDLAIQESIVVKTVVIKRHKDNLIPPLHIIAVKTANYDNSRPSWIDDD